MGIDRKAKVAEATGASGSKFLKRRGQLIHEFIDFIRQIFGLNLGYWNLFGVEDMAKMIKILNEKYLDQKKNNDST